MLIVILGLLTSLQIVAAQALWKSAVAAHQFKLTTSYIFSGEFLGLVFSPAVIFGVLLYASATLTYLALLSKYQFAVVQSLVLTASLIITFLIANFVFHEH